SPLLLRHFTFLNLERMSTRCTLDGIFDGYALARTVSIMQTRDEQNASGGETVEKHPFSCCFMRAHSSHSVDSKRHCSRTAVPVYKTIAKPELTYKALRIAQVHIYTTRIPSQQLYKTYKVIGHAWCPHFVCNWAFRFSKPQYVKES